MQPVNREDMGPTWQDVYDYVHRLELMWRCTVYLQMRLYMLGKPERLYGQCSAYATRQESPLGDHIALGTHGFKGQAGAKTAPGAYWHALSDLEGRLAGVEKVGQASLPL